ncbi:MAG: metallophosphoesterase [Solirubrobacteraceae bacterium]
MRTLVVSDLHLGALRHNGVLQRPAPLRRLLAALADVDRLVLLGDIVDLAEGRPGYTMRVAEPVLRAIGERVGSAREVLVVPGNHDRRLVSRWVEAEAEALTPASTVPLDASPALARLAALLAPARISAHYPGAWLSDRVWATHGHYLDRHLFPESAFGLARGLLGRLPRDGATPIAYERARRPSLVRAARWLPRPAIALLDDLAEVARAATMPHVPRRLLQPRYAPLFAAVLETQMRNASIPALARVVHRLAIDAETVVFGHVHRLGPLAGDRPGQWRGPGDRPRILNSGSWVYEPLLLHGAVAPHPYWPGGAVLLDADADPRAIGLLDDLDAEALR